MEKMKIMIFVFESCKTEKHLVTKQLRSNMCYLTTSKKVPTISHLCDLSSLEQVALKPACLQNGPLG